jgi:hypothetical protein
LQIFGFLEEERGIRSPNSSLQKTEEGIGWDLMYLIITLRGKQKDGVHGYFISRESGAEEMVLRRIMMRRSFLGAL